MFIAHAFIAALINNISSIFCHFHMLVLFSLQMFQNSKSFDEFVSFFRKILYIANSFFGVLLCTKYKLFANMLRFALSCVIFA